MEKEVSPHLMNTPITTRLDIEDTYSSEKMVKKGNIKEAEQSSDT